MIGERLASRSLALERLDGLSPVRGLFGRQLVFGRRCFQVFELQLHLLQQPRLALRAAAVKLPAQLLDLKLEMADQCFRARQIRLGIGRFGAGINELNLRLKAGRALGNNHRMRSGKIGWQRFKLQCHATTESYSLAAAKKKLSSHRRRPPRLLWISPINAGQKITELGGRDDHHSIRRAWPQEPAAFQPLREQAGALAVVPDYLQQIAAAAAKAKQMPAQRIVTQYLLNLQRQARKTLPHVGVAGRKPHPYASRNRNHRRTRTANTRASAVASTPWSTTTRCPQFRMISIRPGTTSARAEQAVTAR